MMRTALIIMFSTLISSFAYGQTKVKVCDTAVMLSEIFQLKPNQVKWNADLREACSVSSQGFVGSCWANSGVELYNQFFHKYKILHPSRNLSADFYASSHIRNRAIQSFYDKVLTRKQGYTIQDLHDFIFDHGLVFEDQFQFPKIDGKSIRESNKLGEAMYQELDDVIKLGKSFPEYNEILDRYLGKSKEVMPLFVQEKYSEIIRPRSYFKSDVDQLGIHQIEKEIIQSIDQRVPVQFAMYQFDNRITIAKKTSHIFGGKLIPGRDGGGGHAMNIVGYRLNTEGKVDLYLIENSHGTKFGTDGFATVQAKYLYDRTRVYVVAPALQKVIKK